MIEATIGGKKFEVHDVDIQFDHSGMDVVGHVEDIVNTNMEVSASVRLTRYGRKFMRMIAWQQTPAGKAGYVLVNKRGKYKLQKGIK